MTVIPVNPTRDQSPLPARAVAGDPLTLEVGGALRSRVAPGLSRSGQPPALDRMNGEYDWIWIAWPQLASQSWRTPRGHGVAVTWDADCLSRSAFTAARALAGTHPSRAAARALAGASWVWFERQRTRGLTAISTPSERDRAWLRRTSGVPIFTVRNYVDTDALADVRATRASAAGRRVLFLGSDFEPNLHGLDWFIQRVWPRVRSAVPDAELILVGRGLDERMLTPPVAGVQLVGEVPEVETSLRESRLVVCPIFYGAGIPNKVLQGAGAARPTLITRHCAASLGSHDGFVLCDSATDWTESVVRFLQSPELADQVGADAIARVERDFGRATWEVEMEKLCAAVVRQRSDSG